jgi:hypothetical protein
MNNPDQAEFGVQRYAAAACRSSLMNGFIAKLFHSRLVD